MNTYIIYTIYMSIYNWTYGKNNPKKKHVYVYGTYVYNGNKNLKKSYRELEIEILENLERCFLK